jgi:peroxidase
MQPYASFAQLTADAVLQQNLQAVYGSIDGVDVFMGGLAEAHAPGAAVGPTFQAIISDQFRRLRDGDRFFWQNEGFDLQTAATIASTTLADMVMRNTGTTNLQPDVFVEAAFPLTPAASLRRLPR